MKSLWPRSRPCLADYGKHRWSYAADRSTRECMKCGTFQRKRPRSEQSPSAGASHNPTGG